MEEMFYFGSWFQRFQSLVGQFHSFWASDEAEYHDREHVLSKAIHLLAARQQRERES
jgi:hypothetical protein